MRKSVWIIAWMVLGLQACTPDPLYIEIEQLDSKPVIWSQVLPGDVTLVYFSRTFAALEYDENGTNPEQDLLSQFLVSDGLVTIVHQGVEDTLLYVSDGLYATFSTPLEEGNSYLLKAEDFDLGKSVLAQTTMLPFVSLDTLSATVLSQNSSFKSVRIDYRFEDLPGDDWYQLNFYSSFNDPFSADNPFEIQGLSETQLLSDLTFETGVYEGSFQLDFLEFDTVFVSLAPISQEYFEYLSLRQRSGGLFTQIVQEPINYPSNVEGGYGFFNMQIPDVSAVAIP